MSDTPRDQDANATTGDAPTPRRPEQPAAGRNDAPPPGSPGDRGAPTSPPGPSAGAGDAGQPGAGQVGAGRADADRTGSRTARAGSSRADRIAGATAEAGSERRQRRRRRLIVAGISAGAALLIIALCAGLLATVAAVSDFRDDAGAAHERRELRDAECLALEERLNRLIPPGATTSPQARATAVRDENTAVRIYVDALTDPRRQDGWRRLLDARTAYAEALDRQARARTPAFFVAPRDRDGRGLAAELIDGSPAPCAGVVRRLAAPDL